MIALRNVIVFVGISLATLAGPVPFAHAQTNSADLPPDATQLVSRQFSCLELYKKTFDPKNKTQIDDFKNALQSIKCGEVENDEKSLRLKYADNPEILEAIKPKWVKVIQRIPVRDPHLDLKQPR